MKISHIFYFETKDKEQDLSFLFVIWMMFLIIHEKLEYLVIWVYHNTDNKKFV